MGDTLSRQQVRAFQINAYQEERAARIRHILSQSFIEDDEGSRTSPRMGRKTHKRNRSIVEEQAELEKEELERKNMEKQAKGNGANASVYTIDLIGEDLKKESTNSFLIVSPTSSSATSPVSPILSKHRRNQSEPVNPYNKPSHLTYPRSEGIPLSSTKRSSPIAEKTYLPDDTLKLDTPTESSEAIHLGEGYYIPALDDKKKDLSGYALRTSDILSNTAIEKGSDEERLREDEQAMFELVDNLSHLSPEEKIDFAFKVCRWDPDFVRSLRDELRIRLEKKERNVTAPYYFDWNNNFQSLLEELENSEEDSQSGIESYAKLAKLAQDFVQCATIYGKIIISEVGVPYEEKSVKPVEMGGFAGGQKYVVKNILFKFALDQHELYGSDEIAAKVAGRDLQGLIQYFNIGIPDLHFPLMALVDYMGFRLQALSLLPINRSTIIYGTPDGGNTIYDENTKFNAKMKLAAQKLNLKPHNVGLGKDEGKLLYSCADLEGHLGEDGRMYCIDFARCFPPVAVDQNQKIKNAHLFRTFRPEFVRHYSIALCPDTYSGFVANQPRKLEHILQIKDATKYLYDEIIPEFVKELYTLEQKTKDTKSISIKELMHKRGINLFMMGHIRNLLKPESIFKKILIVEMVSRVSKHQINQILRDKMQQLKLALQQPYKEEVVMFLNKLFGATEISKEFWNQIKSIISANYPKALSEEEMDSNYDLKKYFIQNNLLCSLFKTLQKLSALYFTPYAQKEFSENPKSYESSEPFDDTDMEGLRESIKHMNIIATSMGYYLSQKALIKSGENSLRLFHQAIEKFEEALSSNPFDKVALRELANIYAYLGNKELSKQYFKEAINADGTDPLTWLKYAIFLEESGDLKMAEQYYLKSLEFDPNNITSLMRYADFLVKDGKKDDAEKFYEIARRYSDIIQSVKDEEIFENERRNKFGNVYSKSNLLPTDGRGPWSTKKGTPKKEKEIKLPPNWEWIDEWTIDKDKEVDEEGWEYANSWRSTEWFKGPQVNPPCYVRRRRWKRTRRYIKFITENGPQISEEEIIIKMQSPQGVQISDRKKGWRTYSRCFVGSEAVQWLMVSYKLTRLQAVQLGRKLMNSGYLRHVSYDQVFTDADYLYQFTEKANQIVSNPSSLSSSSIGMANNKEHEFNKVIKEGYLEKQGALVKNWKRRYFILKKGSLYYYKEKEAKTPRGLINLINAQVTSNESSNMNYVHTFCILTGNRTWIIAAKDEAEKQSWIQAISASVL